MDIGAQPSYLENSLAAHGLPTQSYLGTPKMDWIDSFLQYTDGIYSPPIFRKWGAIAALSGAMERRLWCQTGAGKAYPNLFVLLVSPPGVGKSMVIQQVERLWNSTKKLSVAPHNFTKAALIDELVKACKNRLVNGQLVEWASLLISAGELGNFISSHDLEFLSAANYLWDSPDNYRESKRMFKGANIDIINPQISMLAGTQPGFMSSVLPEQAWTMGTTSRMLMIYAAMAPKISLFSKRTINTALGDNLTSYLCKINDLSGEFTWAPEAVKEFEVWYEAGCPPIPSHSKLTHYIPRRHFMTIKLCMVASISRGTDLEISLDDFERAKSWLLEAETLMPDIFRDMAGKSDAEVIQELHRFLYITYIRTNKKPVSRQLLIHFLSTRTPSEKIPHILRTCEDSGIIERMAGVDMYVPKPLSSIMPE